MPISSSGTPRSSPSNGTNTVAKSSEREPQTDGFPSCQCGKGMSDCSIHPHTREKWIASMQASLARICLSLESNPAWERVQEAVCIGKSSELLASFDPTTSSLKMSQQSFLTDSNVSYPTWPRSGMTVAGLVYGLPNVVPIISAIDGGCWPTPRANKIGGKSSPNFGPTLEQTVKMWPTPAARDYRSQHQNNSPAFHGRKSHSRGVNLVEELQRRDCIGKLNPFWVEWLMGWPIGYSVSKHWVTGRCQSKPQQPGESLEGHE